LSITTVRQDAAVKGQALGRDANQAATVATGITTTTAATQVVRVGWIAVNRCYSSSTITAARAAVTAATVIVTAAGNRIAHRAAIEGVVTA